MGGSRWGRGSVACAFSAVLLLASASSAQDAPEPMPAVPSAEEVAPIAIPEIAGRADDLASLLRIARERLAPAEEVDAIRAELETLPASLADDRAATLDVLTRRPTLARLGDLEREWSRPDEELGDWRRVLTTRAGSLENELAQLRRSQAVWRATLESARSSDAPAEVIQVVEHSIASLGDVQQAASARRSQVLALQNRVSQQELVVAEVLDAVRDARSGLQSRLLEPDQPLIWSAMSARTPTGERILSLFESNVADVQEFLEERRDRLLTLAILFVLAWIAARGLQRSITTREAAGSEIEDSSRVFQRPFALASLIGLLGAFRLFPLAPDALRDLIGLLLLIPMLRLLPSLVHPGFRPMLYAVAGFYVVDRIRDLFAGAPLEARVVFGLECAAAALICFVLLRPSRLEKVQDAGRFPYWAGRVVRFGFVVFTAAFVANVLGYVSLAKLVGEGLLTSLYIAIGLYAGAQVLGIILNVTTKTAWAHQIHFLRARRSVAVDWIRWAISAAAFVLWGYWSLEAFAIEDAVIGGVRGVLTAELTLGTASISLADVLLFGLTIGASIVLSRSVRFVLMEDFFPRVRTGRGIPYAVSATANYVILLVGFMLALAAAGIDFSRFTLLAGAFGVGIGFGLQNVVNNFVSGLILLYERPIQVGDAIDMGDLVGHVRRIGIRSSTVRTLSGAEVIVPNADLISQRVINWTLSDKARRIEVSIGVKYGTDVETVLDLLRSVADASENVLKQPPPSALFRGHGDSSLDFELRAWIANFDDWFRIDSELNTAINLALKAADIEIPFPQRDLHLRSVDEPAARALGDREDAS